MNLMFVDIKISHDDLETQRRPVRGQYPGHVTSVDPSEAMSGGEVIEGFLCPLCMKDLGDVIQLQVSTYTFISFAVTFQKPSLNLYHIFLSYLSIDRPKFNLYRSYLNSVNPSCFAFQVHFDEAHSKEDQAFVQTFKELFGKAKRILADDPDTGGGAQVGDTYL